MNEIHCIEHFNHELGEELFNLIHKKHFKGKDDLKDLLESLPIKLKGDLSDLQALDECISIYAPHGEFLEETKIAKATFTQSAARYVTKLIVETGKLVQKEGYPYTVFYPGTDIPIDIFELIREKIKLGAAADPGDGLEPLLPREEAYGTKYKPEIALSEISHSLETEVNKEKDFALEFIAKLNKKIPGDLEIFNFADNLIQNLPALKEFKELSDKQKVSCLNGIGVIIALFLCNFCRTKLISNGSLITVSLDLPVGRFFPIARAHYLYGTCAEGMPDKIFEMWRIPAVLSMILNSPHIKRRDLKNTICEYLPELRSDEASLQELSSALSAYNS